MDFLHYLFDTDPFNPRAFCGNWSRTDILIHTVSDFLTWLCYVIIPGFLFYIRLKRKDIPFNWIFVMFGLFIFSCGTGHLIEVIIFRYPIYHISGIVKILTAVSSILTVFACWRVTPIAIAIKSPAQAEQMENFHQILKDADRRKNDFLAMLAHELRNPLAPIANSIYILKRQNIDEETREMALEMVERQVLHMSRLIDDLLDVSRIMRSKIELRKSEVKLNDVVRSGIEVAQPLINSRQHALYVSIPCHPIVARVDHVRIAQVVGNLLVNAAKYTPPGGTIHVNLEGDTESSTITIRDNGEGISDECLPYIFDTFYQVDRSLDREKGGLGIGLALVKSLVEMHGGTITAASFGQGKGAEFKVILPSYFDSGSAEHAVQPPALANVV